MMLLRSTLTRNAPRALQTSTVRGMASAVAPGPRYDVSESAGVKVANRDAPSSMGSLILVAKAGPRYQLFPGFSEALESFAFKVGAPCPIGSHIRYFHLETVNHQILTIYL